VHYGRATDVLAKRNAAIQHAWMQHPRRFHPHGPATYALTDSVYINRPPLEQLGATTNQIIDSTNATNRCLTNV
jgi:hypothetical protein